MRVLFLRRQSIGGLASYSDALAFALAEQDIEVVIDNAESWIPNETGWSVDRKVTKLVRDAAKGFDLMHAWGMRSAWACSEAFYLRFPWVATAYDMPKTTAQPLIDRLGAARSIICSSRAVKDALDDANLVNLDIIVPGVYKPDHLVDQAVARQSLGLEETEKIALVLERDVPENCLSILDDVANQLVEELPNASIVIAGIGKVSQDYGGKGCRVLRGDFDQWLWLSAADLILVPGNRKGFSVTAAYAMLMGKPVLARKAGGLPEMGVENVSLDLFEKDEEIFYSLYEILNAPIHANSLGNAARIRAEDRFDLQRCAADHARLYRDLLS